MIVLTQKQELGLNIALEAFKNRKERHYIVIAGYAGTGKSTLVKSIVDALGNVSVGFATYTGKAASVLTRKGNKGATTLHKLLYTCVPQKDGTFKYVPNDSIDYDVVIIDECSMVPQNMIDQLLSYNVFVIFCGDPAQLPPVCEKNEESNINHLLETPDVFLDEIMRQAAESDIIKMSMNVRQGLLLPNEYQGKDLRIIDARAQSPEMLYAYLAWGDEIIVGTNNTRRAINNAMRAYYGREGAPQNGDKIICTHNDWNILSNDNNPLTNGTVGYITNYYESCANYFIPEHRSYETKKRVSARNLSLNYSVFDFETDFGDVFPQTRADKQLLEISTPSVTNEQIYWINRYKKNSPLPSLFEYGYAITCHKAQGSEWDKITIVLEAFPYEKIERIRWIYTAITRASKQCTIIVNFKPSMLL